MEFKNAKAALAWLCNEAQNIGRVGNITHRCCQMASGDYITGTGGTLDSRIANEVNAKVDIENILLKHFSPIQQRALLIWGGGDFEDAVKFLKGRWHKLPKEKLGRKSRRKRPDPVLKFKSLIRRFGHLLREADYLTNNEIQ
jgi:hypothetical protein